VTELSSALPFLTEALGSLELLQGHAFSLLQGPSPRPAHNQAAQAPHCQAVALPPSHIPLILSIIIITLDLSIPSLWPRTAREAPPLVRDAR
jgi:hypothetical protein